MSAARLQVPARVAAFVERLHQDGGELLCGLEAWKHDKRARNAAIVRGWVELEYEERNVDGITARAPHRYRLTAEGREVAQRIVTEGVDVEDLEVWSKQLREARARARGDAA